MRNRFCEQTKKISPSFSAQEWYTPSGGISANIVGYTKEDQACLNRVYTVECPRCGICMQGPSTPENTLQFQVIREVFKQAVLTLNPNDKAMSDELYPIGFTVDGTQLAYVKFEANESMNCALWTLESFDTENQRVHKLSTWTDHQETECLPSAAAFGKHRMLFMRRLTTWN